MSTLARRQMGHLWTRQAGRTVTFSKAGMSRLSRFISLSKSDRFACGDRPSRYQRSQVPSLHRSAHYDRFYRIDAPCYRRDWSSNATFTTGYRVRMHRTKSLPSEQSLTHFSRPNRMGRNGTTDTCLSLRNGAIGRNLAPQTPISLIQDSIHTTPQVARADVGCN